MSFTEYEIGKENNQGKKICKILHRVQDKYVIYKCENDNNIWFDGLEDIKKNVNAIYKRLAKIEIITQGKKNDTFVTSQLVYAATTAAEGNIKEAFEILDKLELELLNIKSNMGRVYYLIGSFCTIILQLIILAIGNWPGNLLIIHMSLLGSLGGVLSILRRIRNIEVDPNSGFFQNLINGISRITISAVCSIFIFFLIKSNIVLGILNDISKSDNIYAYYVFAIIAGFSENFVPNIFNRIEVDTTGTTTSSSSF